MVKAHNVTHSIPTGATFPITANDDECRTAVYSTYIQCEELACCGKKRWRECAFIPSRNNFNI